MFFNKVNSLKRKIRELGPINTLAPEEYDKVSTRYEFLIHQQEDLQGAENTLLEIINEMLEMVKNQGISLLVVTHNRSFIEKFDVAYEIHNKNITQIK